MTTCIHWTTCLTIDTRSKRGRWFARVKVAQEQQVRLASTSTKVAHRSCELKTDENSTFEVCLVLGFLAYLAMIMLVHHYRYSYHLKYREPSYTAMAFIELTAIGHKGRPGSLASPLLITP